MTDRYYPRLSVVLIQIDEEGTEWFERFRYVCDFGDVMISNYGTHCTAAVEGQTAFLALTATFEEAKEGLADRYSPMTALTMDAFRHGIWKGALDVEGHA